MGTFGERSGLVADDRCAKCTAGHYCQFSGKSNVTGPCDGGEYKIFERLKLKYKSFYYDIASSTLALDYDTMKIVCQCCKEIAKIQDFPG